MTNLIFAYGTLRPSLSPGAVERFNLKSRGFATLRGAFQMLNLGAFPGLVLDLTKPTVNITGEVVEVTTLDQADRYEGCRHGAKDNLYDRQEVAVKLYTGVTVTAWVYLFNLIEHAKGAEIVKSGDWAKR